MIQKKICMLGAFGVGKTSLVSRFIRSLFSDKYQTTIGVKIDKKQITVSGSEVTLMLWDVAGEDDAQKVNPVYLRGAAGYILVVDRTRKLTCDVAIDLQTRVEQAIGPVPLVVVLNKSDLPEQFDLTPEQTTALSAKGWPVIEASAKLGQGVEEAFATLTAKMLG